MDAQARWLTPLPSTPPEPRIRPRHPSQHVDVLFGDCTQHMTHLACLLLLVLVRLSQVLRLLLLQLLQVCQVVLVPDGDDMWLQ